MRLVVWSPRVRPLVSRPNEAVRYDNTKKLLTVYDLSTCVPARRGYGGEDHLRCAHYRFTKRRIRTRARTGTGRGRNRS
jgi:hypothetical protein